MAYKAVLFQRVSTTKQDTYRQNSALFEQANKDGYSDEEVYVIDYKESAVKLSYQQRQGMMELEAVMEENPIEIVYVHEISRVARREDVTFTLIQKLTERGINLHIQTPQIIRTLNPDGTENAIAKLVITFLAYFANEEAKQMKIRVKGGRKALLEKGQVFTSSVKFGYKVVNKRVVINEEEAKYVKQIFDDYISTDFSTVELFIKYKDMGILSKCKINHKEGGSRYISELLKDKCYCGKHKTFIYPAIVSEETVDKAIQKLKEKAHAKRTTNELFYCRGLLKIKTNDNTEYTLSPNSYYARYTYHTRTMLDGSKKLETWTLSANLMDTIARNEAFLMYSVFSANKAVNDKEWALERVKVLQDEIAAFERKIKTNEKSFERTLTLYKRGTIELEDVDIEKKMFDKETEILNGKINNDKAEMANLTAMLSKEEGYVNTLENLFNSTPERTYEIIHAMIERIDVEKISNGDFKFYIIPKVNLNYNEGDVTISVSNDKLSYYHYKVKSRWITLTKVHNGIEQEYTGEFLKIHKSKR